MKLIQQMKALRQGDTAAFAVIYEATKKAVYFMALSVLKNRAAAEDAMQSAYVRVLKNVSQYNGGSVSAWVVKIARNTALNMLKHESFSVSVDVEENVNLFGSTTDDDMGLMLDGARRVLDDEEFQIILMIAVHAYKRREVAEVLDMPIATVTWKYRRALNKLRSEFGGDGKDGERKRI